MLDKARETAGDLVEKAQPVVDKAVEAGGGLLDKAKDLLTQGARSRQRDRRRGPVPRGADGE